MSIFEKIKQLFSTTSKPSISVNVSSVPAPTANAIDKYKFPTIESILNVNVAIPNIDYILQRKATQFKKEGKMDFAIACLKKSNDIMLSSNNKYRYSAKDYMRYIKYLEADGQFDKATLEEEKLKARLPALFDGANTKNPQLTKINTDLIHFTGSRLCPLCSIYSGRVFSKSGRDKRFPAFSVFPEKLKNVNCPECGVCVGFSPYHIIDFDNKLRDDIKRSNAPFTDSRTTELKKTYTAQKEESASKAKNKAEYDLVSKVLPDLAPKSLSGYSRMKTTKSTNYLKIVKAMRSSGYPNFAENENITKEI